MTRYKAVKINCKKFDEHRLIAERMLGRKLMYNEVVHHINGDKMDNREENLVVMSRKEHNRLHLVGKRNRCHFSEEAKRKLSECARERARLLWKAVEQVDENGNVVRVYSYANEVGDYGFDHAHVIQCCNNKRKTHKGFAWRYKK